MWNLQRSLRLLLLIFSKFSNQTILLTLLAHHLNDRKKNIKTKLKASSISYYNGFSRSYLFNYPNDRGTVKIQFSRENPRREALSYTNTV